MLQPGNYSLVLSLQFLLLIYDLFVNSFSELLRSAPVIQLVLFMQKVNEVAAVQIDNGKRPTMDDAVPFAIEKLTTIPKLISMHERCLWSFTICGLQDVGTLFAAIVLFLMLFNTFAFQAGLLGLLFHRFQVTVFFCALHLALSVSLHVWIMNLRWKDGNVFIWSDGLQALFVLQRVVAVLYFYFYKRTALNLGDPCYYRDSLWLRNEFARIRG